MTVKMLTAWNGYPKDYIGAVISTSEEARLVGIGFASYDLDGVDNDNVRMPVTASKTLTGGIELSAGGDKFVVSSNDTEPVASLPFLALRSDANYDLVTVPSPYAPGHVLHASVLYFKDGKQGYKYWMAYTPYPDSDSNFENPCIAVSNDGRDWATPAGLTNPIFLKPARAGSFNSDTDLYFDNTTKSFVLLWRTVGEVGSDVNLWISTSADGVTWAQRTRIFEGVVNSIDLASPSIWYNQTSAKWEILGHNVGTAGAGALRKITSSNLLSGWDAALTSLTFAPPSGRQWWHAQYKRLPDGSVVGLVQDNPGTPGSSGNMYSAYSADGTTFSFSPLDLFGGWYRPAFVIRDDVVRGEYYVEFFGSKLLTAGIFHKLMRFEKGTNQISALTRNSLLSSAALGLSPTILADTFNRANDATTLGSSTNGRAWTTVSGPTNVLGIIDGKCYNVTTGNCRSTMDVGVSDYLARFTLDTKSAEIWLLVRVIDTSNLIRVGVSSAAGLLKVQRVTGGSITSDVALAVTPNNGDEVIVRCAGSQITVWLGERLVSTSTEIQGVGATLVGVQMTGALGGRVDNLLVTSL